MADLIRISSTVTLTSTPPPQKPQPLTPPTITTLPTPRLHTYPTILPTIITQILTHLQNNQPQSPQSTTTPFYALELPQITIHAYATRLVRYSYCPPAGILVALYFIRKLLDRKLLKITNETFHRILLTAIVISAKCCTDFFLSNEFYAKVGGVCVKELNVLEEEMLKLLEWECFVGEDEYGKEVEGWVVGVVMKEGGSELREFMGKWGFGEEVDGGGGGRGVGHDVLLTSPCSSTQSSPRGSPGGAR